MKHGIIALVFATIFASVFISCSKGKDGEPGPTGPQGVQGVQGSAGTSAPGATTSLLPYSNGSITGTLTGSSQQNNEDFTQRLNFKYFKSPSDNFKSYQSEGNYEKYIITRYDSVGSSYITFDFRVYYYDETEDGGPELPHIENATVTIVSNKKLADNNVFYFGTTYSSYSPFEVSSVQLSENSSGGNSNITIDNLTIDSNSGLLNFDYSLELGSFYNSSGNTAYMDGSVSVTPYNVSYREGAE